MLVQKRGTRNPYPVTNRGLPRNPVTNRGLPRNPVINRGLLPKYPTINQIKTTRSNRNLMFSIDFSVSKSKIFLPLLHYK